MTPSEILSAFRRRCLDIDCFEIALVQNTEAGAISLRGPGYIRQGEDDRIGFKIYAVEITDLLCRRFRHQTAGTLYSESDYYSLSATGVDGSQWTAARILPELRWVARTGNGLVTGDITAIAQDWFGIEG